MNPIYFLFIGVPLILIGVLTDVWILVIVGALALILIPIISNTSDKNLKVNTSLSAKDIFKKQNMENYFIGEDNLTCIGINEEDETVTLLHRKLTNQEFKYKTLPFSKIFEVKINEDDVTLTSTSRGSQIGGALVGGMIGGVVGSAVGAMTANQYSEQEVKKINLEIVVDELSSPVFNVSFMNEYQYYKKYEPRYKNKFEIANHWYKMLSVIIKRNEINKKSI